MIIHLNNIHYYGVKSILQYIISSDTFCTHNKIDYIFFNLKIFSYELKIKSQEDLHTLRTSKHLSVCLSSNVLYSSSSTI